MKIRSFLAFDIPDELKGEFRKVIALLAPKVKGVKWVDLGRMHCTIRFFGDVEEEFLMGKLSKMIEGEVRHQAPFNLAGHGLGVFPNWRYPRVLWAGLQGDNEAVISLRAKLDKAFGDLDIKGDPRVLRLHLTLGRAKSPFKISKDLVKVVEKMVDEEFGDFTVDSLTLYKSVLTKEGPVYTALKKFPLGGGKNHK